MQKLILGITGGIAAYKAAELARIFVRAGIDVQAVLTPAAAEFITPLTLQTLTGRPAYIEMYTERTDEKVRHIDLLGDADLLLVAPASANTIGKMACGLADNLLTTLYLAADCPVMVVPSMNVNMFKHAAVRENIEKLISRGCLVMDPDEGELACGVYGSGRMPDPVDIYSYAVAALKPKDYKGICVTVTAGPTREALDPVRYLSNPSTGLMGYALARALKERGAEVTLISGPTHLKPPAGVKTVSVNTADEMCEAVFNACANSKVLFKAAAVSDFKPAEMAGSKVKKEDAACTLSLERNRDILLEMGQQKKGHILVGFAAETEEAVENAHDKMIRKNLDLIVVNNLNEPGAGFAVPTNRVSIIERSGEKEELPLMEKEQLAHHILDRTINLIE